MEERVGISIFDNADACLGVEVCGVLIETGALRVKAEMVSNDDNANRSDIARMKKARLDMLRLS